MHTTKPLSSPMRRLRASALLLVAPMSISACAAAPSPTVSDRASGLGATWGGCMRDAGFEVPDPTDADVRSGAVPAPDDADQRAFGEQAERCSETAGLRRPDAAQRQTWERQYAQVAECIRAGGFDDLPEQAPGVLDFHDYPRASEPSFADVSGRCLAEFAPDTQIQDR